MIRAILQHIRRFVRDTGGGIAVTAGLALPPVLVLGVGAIDLTSVQMDRTKIQDTVDAAAIQAAQQLSASDATALAQRTQAFVESQLGDLKYRTTYRVSTVVAADGKSLQVSLQGRRTSFFGGLLPPGGWPLNVSATAAPAGSVPLCVLSSGQSSTDNLKMAGTSQVTAAKCLVESNSDIAVGSTAWLQAALVQSSGLATGRITPAPQQGAPVIEDPFSGMSLAIPNAPCVSSDIVYTDGAITLPPGVHCGNITVKGTATLTLAPGEHYFKAGELLVNQTASLTGEDVVLVFDSTADFQFTGTSTVNLSGRRTGSYAGFVITTSRENTRTLLLASNAARKLLGVIYVPSAELNVQGTNKIADESAWTVIVAKSIKTSGGPNLVINSDYAASSVPVPTGVGPMTKGALLQY